MAEAIEGFYTASQAAEVLSRNSGKAIKPLYVSTLARYGILHPVKVTPRVNLYPREEVDRYVVEERGLKSGERFKQQAALRKKKRGRKKAAL
jgi:hypothetical protein